MHKSKQRKNDNNSMFPRTIAEHYISNKELIFEYNESNLTKSPPGFIGFNHSSTVFDYFIILKE